MTTTNYKCFAYCNTSINLSNKEYESYFRNHGDYICKNCLSICKQNMIQPFKTQHKDDTSFFANINNSARAYVTAYLHGNLLKSNTSIFQISLPIEKLKSLLYIRNLINGKLPILQMVDNYVVCITNEKMNEDFMKTEIISPGFTIDSLRGYYESVGCCKMENGEFICSIQFFSKDLVSEIREYVQDIPFHVIGDRMIWTGVNAVDFLALLYKDATVFDKSCYKRFLYKIGGVDNFCFKRTIENSPAPHKKRFTDSGYDLHLVKKVKDKDGLIVFDTGIAISPPHGYYFDVVPRSSLCKKGWGLSNSVGIIDAAYSGSINIALFKLREDAEELELPFKAVQIIPRKIHFMYSIEVSELKQTSRNDQGGLGSVHFKEK